MDTGGRSNQRRITTALHDVATVQFIAAREQVIVSKDGCATVRDNGILILLGPPTPVEGATQVGINGYVACLGATWFTYVVTHRGDGWQVAGITGPTAIS
jgi:hypothetical protein